MHYFFWKKKKAAKVRHSCLPIKIFEADKSYVILVYIQPMVLPKGRIVGLIVRICSGHEKEWENESFRNIFELETLGTGYSFNILKNYETLHYPK